MSSSHIIHKQAENLFSGKLCVTHWSLKISRVFLIFQSCIGLSSTIPAQPAVVVLTFMTPSPSVERFSAFLKETPNKQLTQIKNQLVHELTNGSARYITPKSININLSSVPFTIPSSSIPKAAMLIKESMMILENKSTMALNRFKKTPICDGARNGCPLDYYRVVCKNRRLWDWKPQRIIVRSPISPYYWLLWPLWKIMSPIN